MYSNTRNTAPSRSKLSSHGSFTDDLVKRHGEGVETASLHTSAADRTRKMREKIARASGVDLRLIPDDLDSGVMPERAVKAAVRLGYLSPVVEHDADESAAIADAVTAVRANRRARGWSA